MKYTGQMIIAVMFLMVLVLLDDIHTNLEATGRIYEPIAWCADPDQI